MKDLVTILICAGLALAVIMLVWLFVPDFAAWMKFLLLA